MLKVSAGFKLPVAPPAPVPFTKAHFGGGKHQPIVLQGIANVENVNRLVSKASLAFCPKALTIVYGRNGSGKSGFVRILRTACRTRVENPAKLKVLADVYGSATGPQTADILVDAGAGEVAIPWSTNKTALPELVQVAVFDTASAQLYVDGGNQIRFLPFGLALPHRLNTVCLNLREKLEAERTAQVGSKVELTATAFTFERDTISQTFDRSLAKTTTDAQIDAAAAFSTEDEKRLGGVTAALSAGASSAADVGALVNWTATLSAECAAIADAFGDTALEAATNLKNAAVSARQAATVAAGALFTEEPLPGVGSETWRALWAAARDYSVSEAYPEQSFPVLVADGDEAACVLCHQPILSDGAARMQQFQKYMDDTLDATAKEAEQAVTNAITNTLELSCLRAEDFPDRLEQVRKRDPELAIALSTLRGSALQRRADVLTRLKGEPSMKVPALIVPLDDIKTFESQVKAEQGALEQATDDVERAKLSKEKAELEDRKTLAANKAKLTIRRDLLVIDNAFAMALSDLQTRGITLRANELVDTHLTTAVTSRFDDERTQFDIMHLKVGLVRRSSQTKAEFEVDTQTKLTKVTSEILSEGEQRALALAGFLTEVALTDGSGPIVIDDPVSSLDRDRSTKVAKRIALEASERQVIVFNELTTQTQPELKAVVTKMVQRIDLNAECITIQPRLSGLHDLVTAEEAHAKFNLLSDAISAISAPLQFKKRGVETKIIIGDRLQAAYEPNQALIMLIAQAHHWLDRLTTGSVTSIIDLAIEEQVDKNKISRALRYAYLAPDIIQTIFEGRQPVDLTAETMRRLPDLPMEWRDQRNLLGFH